VDVQLALQSNPDEAVNDRAMDKLLEYAQILVDAVPDTVENINFIAF